MLKNNKGITLIALAITIIILIILTSIATYTGFSTVKDSKYYDAVSQMRTMQAKVNEFYEDYKNGDTSFLDKGTTIAEGGKETQAIKAYNSTKQNNLNGTDIGEYTDYKYYSKDVIENELDIEGIDYDFIINIEKRMVILIDGVKRNEVTYYSLCEIDGEQYNVE